MFQDGCYIDVEDGRLFVAEAGRADGPPVLLLHGGLQCSYDFEGLGQQLAATHRLIALDTRGHGRSYLGEVPLTYGQLEQDVAAAVEQLGLGPFGVIGHSDGGITALRLAAARQVPLQFAVVIGAHGWLAADDPARALFAGLTLQDWRAMCADGVARYMAQNPEPDFDRLFAAVLRMWLSEEMPTGYPGEAVRSISCPVLVVRGDEDELVSRRHAVELADRIEGSQLLTLPGADHSVLEVEPKVLAPFILRFMSALEMEPS